MSPAKKRGLGRGLDALLADVNQEDSNVNLDDSLQHFPLDMIQPGKYQPRVDMSQESLEELADSIRAQGLVQPIVVRPIGEGKYEIVAGERRWRDSRMAGLEVVPVLIRDVSDRSAIAMALIENIQRENLNPMEEANALFRLREEFEMTHQQAAEAVGKSRAAVTNLLRLRNLNEDVKKRSLSANAQQHLWYGQISKQQGDKSPLDVKNFCKDAFGLPLVLNSEKHADKMEFLLDKLDYYKHSYESRMKLIQCLEVTSLLTTAESKIYMEQMCFYFNDIGVNIKFKD